METGDCSLPVLVCAASKLSAQTNSESGQNLIGETINHLKRANTNANNPLILD